MIEPYNEFDQLMRRVREGSDEAVRDLLDRYGPVLLRIIRRRLPPGMRSCLDSIDVVQNVWASFFALEHAQCNFATAEDLQAFLARLAYRKVTDVYRDNYETQKRDRNRVRSLDGSAAYQAEGATRSPDPTPSQVAAEDEQWRILTRGMTPEYRRIADYLRHGWSHAAIARELQISEKTIQRVVRRLADRFQDDGQP